VKEALMKKRYGVPAALLVLLIAGGVAAAAFTAVFIVKPTVQYPTSEKKTVSFTVPAGGSFSKTATLDLALPGSYDLEYKLVGNGNDLLKSESATVKIDLDDDGDYDETGESKTISSISDSVTFSNVSKGQYESEITISATARDKTLATVGWSSGDQDLTISSKTTALAVKMEPTKA